jgi:hypothetical protein
VARACYGKITIEHTKEDVLHPFSFLVKGFLAFITPDSYVQVNNASLCWAKSKNPAEVNIPVGGVPEMLQVAWLQQLPVQVPQSQQTKQLPCFNIPSEEGWGDDRYLSLTTKERRFPWRHSRVVLTAKTYTGTLLIGAEDIPPVTRKFKLGYVESTTEPYFELLAN